MGRLYWKFFLAILFAQFLATIGIGATFWLWGQARESGVGPYAGPPGVDTRSTATVMLDAASVAFKFGGVNGLRELVLTAVGKNIYAIDSGGDELLGRPFDHDLFAEAQRQLVSETRPQSIRNFVAADGRQYQVFIARARSEFGPPKMGAGGFFGPPPVFGEPGRPGPHASKGADGRAHEGHRLPYITIAAACLASLLLAAMLAWHIARPIRALRAAFSAAAGGDLTARFDADTRGPGDELAELGSAFDRMSQQLKAILESQQRLLHDVSHELRAPLARLQAAVGLSHQQPENHAKWMDRIEREGNRMEKLIGELLTLSRLDSAAKLPAIEEICVIELLDDIRDNTMLEAGGKCREVHIEGHLDAKVRGSRELLFRAIDNVVRNAIKYSPDHEAVKVDIRVNGRSVELRVFDRGSGVPEHHLADIFLPFYREESAASHAEGHGLGLAIAMRVVVAHGGTIQAHNCKGAGLCVTIALPTV